MQLVEVLDGFGGPLLGMISLFIKQQWEILVCVEKADQICREYLLEEVDGFITVNIDYAFEYDASELIIHYNSRSGKYYKFTISREFGFPRGGLCHSMEYPEDSALADFIQEVSSLSGRHPNPLFRGRETNE